MDDDGFKPPRLPSSGSTKRKAADDFHAPSKGKQRATAVTVEDDDDEDVHMQGSSRQQYSNVDDEDNGYDLPAPPGADGDYFAEEDDGRFFGGGLSSTEKQILDIFDGNDPDESAEQQKVTTVQSVRRQLLALERSINRNAEMRAKWAGQPEKFVDSEVALDTAIQELVLLTQNPREYYPELAKLGIVNSLADLLSHENIDISLAVIQVLEELTDDDVAEGGEGGEDDEEDSDDEISKSASKPATARAAVVSFAQSLLSAQVAELLVNNLARLNEDEEQERTGVYHSLSLVENLLSLQPTLSKTVSTETTLLPWLLKRLQPPKKEKEKREDDSLAQNRQYAAELLSILLQGLDEGRQARLAFGKHKGMETCLRILSAYRKRDPAGAEETEYMENVFDCVCSALMERENKEQFLQEEGVELMVIMMKDKMLARNRAIKVLDHALAGDAGTAACERFVEVLGLKSLFAAFMNKESKEDKKKKRSAHALGAEDEEHILSILSALLSNLESESVMRIRVLTKFVEDDYQKLARLVTIRSNLLARIRRREKELAAEREDLASQGLELEDVEIYLNRLEAGLLSLQLADYILAWVCMEDDGARDRARQLLTDSGSSFAEVVTELKEYQENIGDAPSSAAAVDESSESADTKSAEQGAAGETEGKRQIVQHLMAYLQGC